METKMVKARSNKEVVRQLFELVLNKGNMGLLPDYIAGDYEGLQGKKGVAGFEEVITPLIKAFPDIQWKVEELIGEGDKVVVRWSWKGTHTGQFRNFTPTGKSITNSAIAIYRLKDGKINNVALQTDQLGFLQQLEVLPLDVALIPNQTAQKDRVSFIDKFLVPAHAKNEFFTRMNINRSFIKKLPGFLEDAAYELYNDNGDLVCITIAHWESREALNKAKELVQAEYKKQGFDAAEMFKRLNITVDRGIYTGVNK